MIAPVPVHCFSITFKFQILEEELLSHLCTCSETKVLISCVITTQLICTFVFEYAKSSNCCCFFMTRLRYGIYTRQSNVKT